MSQPTKGERDFVAYLCKLVKDENRPALAALRRSLTSRPGLDLAVYRYVARFVPNEASGWAEEVYYLTAALFALHQNHGEVGNLGASYARLMEQERRRLGSEPVSLEQRFVALLNCDREALPVHLRHAVSLLKSKEVPIDWAQLLHDLKGWERADRQVQRNWAKALWAGAEIA